MKRQTSNDALVDRAILKTMTSCGMTVADFDLYRTMKALPLVQQRISTNGEARDLSARDVHRLFEQFSPCTNLSRECRRRLAHEEKRGPMPAAPLSEQETRERAAAGAQLEQLERVQL